MKTRRDADWPATLSAAQSNCQSWSHLLFWLPRRQCLSVVCLSKHARSWKRHRNDIRHIFTPLFGPTRLDQLVCALPPAPSVRNAVEPLLVFNDSTGFPPARPISKNYAQTKRGAAAPGLSATSRPRCCTLSCTCVECSGVSPYEPSVCSLLGKVSPLFFRTRAAASSAHLDASTAIGREKVRTTRTSSVPDSISPSPRGYGECPARTSWPWEPRLGHRFVCGGLGAGAGGVW